MLCLLPLKWSNHLTFYQRRLIPTLEMVLYWTAFSSLVLHAQPYHSPGHMLMRHLQRKPALPQNVHIWSLNQPIAPPHLIERLLKITSIHVAIVMELTWRFWGAAQKRQYFVWAQSYASFTSSSTTTCRKKFPIHKSNERWFFFLFLNLSKTQTVNYLSWKVVKTYYCL